MFKALGGTMCLMSIMGCARSSSIRVQFDGHYHAYLDFPHATTTCLGGEYVFFCDRPPRTRLPVIYEPVPSSEVLSRLILVGCYDPISRQIAMAVRGIGPYDGFLLLFSDDLSPTEWEHSENRIRVKLVGRLLESELYRRTSEKRVRFKDGCLVQIYLDLRSNGSEPGDAWRLFDEWFSGTPDSDFQSMLERISEVRARHAMLTSYNVGECQQLTDGIVQTQPRL